MAFGFKAWWYSKIVTIDNESYSRIGQSTSMAQIVRCWSNQIIARHPLAIGVILYTELDTYRQSINNCFGPTAKQSFQYYICTEHGPNALAKAIQEAQMFISPYMRDKEMNLDADMDTAFSSLRLFRSRQDPLMQMSRIKYVQAPIKLFSPSKGMGNIDMHTDNDGVLREYQSFKQTNQRNKAWLSKPPGQPAHLSICWATCMAQMTNTWCWKTLKHGWQTVSIFLEQIPGAFRINWLQIKRAFQVHSVL